MTARANLQVTRRTGSRDAEVQPTLTIYVDVATEFAVLAFASWTLLYDLGLALRPATSVLLAAWVPCLAAAAAGLIGHHRGAGGAGATRPAAPPPARGVPAVQPPAHRAAGPAGSRMWKRSFASAAVVCGLAAGAAAAWHKSGVGWRWTYVFGALSVAASVAALRARGRGAADAVAASPAASPRGSRLAFLTAVVLGGFSLFVVRPDGDDAYFVSRAVWTAQHGRIPLRDVIFTNQALPHIKGEPPIASIEVLAGALARLLGVQAASLTYYVVLPVATFFAVWAVWLLIRLWAPARPALCFVTAMVYLLWSGSIKDSIGSFQLVRLWQGKAMFVSVMVPLLYVYLTQWAEHRSRRNLVLALAASVAAVGLHASASMVVPLMAAAAVVAMLLAGRGKRALGAVAFAAYPIAAGIGVHLLDPIVHWPFAAVRPAPNVWAWVMQAGVVGAIGAAALWLAPLTARRGVPALMVTGIAAVATILLLPGVMTLITDVTRVGSTTWRLLWMIPAPVLVGLFAAVPLPGFVRSPSMARWPVAVPAVALCVIVLVAGVPLWSYRDAGAIVASRPRWKYDAFSLKLARKVVSADHSPGYVLSTPKIMSAIPLITSHVHAVDGRDFYLRLLPASRQFIADRELLTGLAGSIGPLPGQAAVNAALSRVGVGFACLWTTTNPGGVRLIEQAGYTPAAHFGHLQCLDKS